MIMGSYSDKQWKFARHTALLILYIDAMLGKATWGDAFRSKEEQQRKFDAGLSGLDPSQEGVVYLHGEKLAIDLNLFHPDTGRYCPRPDPETATPEKIAEHRALFQHIGDFWEGLDPKNVWGGNWDDPYDPAHFQESL